MSANEDDDAVLDQITGKIETFQLESEWEELKSKSRAHTRSFSRAIVKMNRLCFPGGKIAGVVFPEIPTEERVMIIFHSPSSETAVNNPKKTDNWNPFLISGTKKWVKSFQQLAKVVSIDFKKYFLIDMFPGLLWEEDMEILEIDIKISTVWLRNQIDIIKPTRIFIANKKYGALMQSQLCNKNITIICHPSFALRDPTLAKKEWEPVAKIMNDPLTLMSDQITLSSPLDSAITIEASTSSQP